MAKVRVSAEVVSEVIEGRAVLLDLRSGKYFRLNKTGTFIWQRFEGGQDQDSVCVALADAYARPLEGLRADVTSLVEQLADKGLIEVQQ